MFIQQVCNTEKCTGCGLCVSVCPKGCIEMKYNFMGAIEPCINTDKCIACGKCQKKCPSLNKNGLVFQNAKKSYYAKTMNKKIYSKSSSGGICTAIGLEIIKNGGVVYAAVMNPETIQVNHMRIDNENDLYKSQGSKYVQSNISKSIYNSIQIDARNNIPVLFVGTPCQVAAMKKNLGKDTSTVIFVDLVCHGVPGEKVFQEYMNFETNETKFSSISFRKKKNFIIDFSKEEDVSSEVPLTPFNSIYYHGFISGSIYRLSCHNCQYTRHQRLADITLGDTEYSENGDVYNSVIIYSEKGEKLFKDLSDVYSVETNTKDMLNSHAQLNHPVPVNDEQKRFEKYCSEKNIKYALRHMNYKKTALISIRKVVFRKKLLYNIVKKIPMFNHVLLK